MTNPNKHGAAKIEEPTRSVEIQNATFNLTDSEIVELVSSYGEPLEVVEDIASFLSTHYDGERLLDIDLFDLLAGIRWRSPEAYRAKIAAASS